MNLHSEIARVAYELYEKNGRCGGRDLDNWLEAERIVMAQRTVNKSGAAKKGRSRKATTSEGPLVKAPGKKIGKTEKP